MKKKRAFTLLEIMIVIFLIGLIGSIIGYNMKGSLDEGRRFRTEQAILKIQDILELELAKDPNTKLGAEELLKRSGIVTNPKKFLKDGWNNLFKIEIKDGEVTVTSHALEKYKEKKGIEEDDE